MSRITPDGFTKFFFLETIADLDAPTVSEFEAGDHITNFVTPTGVDTPEEGTDADASDLGSPRDKSIPATIGGDLTGEFYRDDGTGGTSDDAWDALPRLKIGYLCIFRFGVSGVDGDDEPFPADGDICEVWPVRVSQRSNNRVVRGEALRFTSRFALRGDPIHDAVVGGGT